MKATGIVRNIDALGRIVVPKEIRDKMGWPEGTAMEIFMEGEQLMLRPYVPGCNFCGSPDADLRFHGKFVCRNCASNLGVEATVV